MKANGESSRREWLEDTFARHEVPLLRYVTSLTGNPERARDIVHDAFLQLCREEQKRVDGHVAPWLFRVCRNRVVDAHRRENRFRPEELAAVEGFESHELSPADAAEIEDSTNLILDIVQTLPSNQQEVIRLKFQCGLSYKEISQITNLSVTNVGFLIHTAIKRIRRRFHSTPAPGHEISSHEYQT